MIFWILLIIIAIILLFYSLIIVWFNDPIQNWSDHPVDNSSDIISTDNINNQDDNKLPIPTIHAICHTDVPCGSDLTCDTICHRCKKKLGGDCAMNVDCESNLRCHNWKCVSQKSSEDNQLDFIDPDERLNVNEIKKNVRWDL